MLSVLIFIHNKTLIPFVGITICLEFMRLDRVKAEGVMQVERR